MKPLVFTARILTFPEFESMHYIEVSKSNVKKLGGKMNIRLVCTLNDEVKFQCGLMGIGGGVGSVMVNRARLKALGLHKGAKVNVKLALDKSKYGLPMPKTLRELLKQDEEGARRFEKLSKGKQRSILHHVGNVKSPDKGLDRAMTVIENLKSLPEGKETNQGIFQSSGKFNRQG